MERQPIIVRNPITLENDLLAQDSIQSSNNLESLVEEINQFNLTDTDKNHMIEDVFMRRFPSLWALKYKTIKGKPTTFISKKSPFKHRPWQQAILDDTHPNIVVEKSRQLGLSEVGMTSCIHFLIMHQQTKAMYIFPRNQQMVDFSKSRVAPVLNSGHYFEQFVDKNLNSVSTKKIGDSYLFMRSGFGSALGEGADTSYLAIDEYDRMKDGVELAFQEGLSSSEYGWMRRWSTPTIPGRGINNLFQKSDQMRYIWTCPHCGHKQYLTFENNIILKNPNGINKVTGEIEDGTYIVGCAKCKKELDRFGVGEWVAQYPSIKETRGYHISQLDAAWISADAIMRRQKNYSSKQLFYNYVIGEPYAAGGLVVTDEDVRASIRIPKSVLGRSKEYVAIVAGIDWGATSYMVILGIKSNGVVDLLNIYTADEDPNRPLNDASMFCAILRTFQPNLVVADAGYGSDKNSYAYTQFPSVWYSCNWTTVKSPTSNVRFLDQWNDNAHNVTVDKTIAVKRVLHSIKGHLIGLFPWDEKISMFCTHLKNTRIMQEEEDGFVYEKATRIGADHSVSAMSYALVGVQHITNYGVSLNAGLNYEFI